jgi:GPN-loop GTPase
VRNLTQMGIRTSAVYLVESQFMEDRYKFFGCVLYSVITCSRCSYCYVSSGVLSAMSAMVNLEIPWINVISKMDLVTENSEDPGQPRNGVRGRKNIARFGYFTHPKYVHLTSASPDTWTQTHHCWIHHAGSHPVRQILDSMP